MPKSEHKFPPKRANTSSSEKWSSSSPEWASRFFRKLGKTPPAYGENAGSGAEVVRLVLQPKRANTLRRMGK